MFGNNAEIIILFLPWMKYQEKEGLKTLLICFFMTQKALIYHTALSENSTPDDLDVLDEVRFVSDTLKGLNYEVEQKPFEVNEIKNEIEKLNPPFIFNLVEAIGGKDSQAYLAPLIFEKLNLFYTGCTASAFIKTESKTKAKITLENEGILTPYWLTSRDLSEKNVLGKKFIIKSKIDHASKGLEPILFETEKEITDVLKSKGDDFFAEEYIPGREFNISMIGPVGNGKVLPIAEMQFVDWSSDKLKIVDYSAKWDSNSEAYNQTQRTFEFSESDKPLLINLEKICKKCWNMFDLRGYARIDFRVAEDKKPYVLEINVNPCISPDAGFIAAAHQAGMTDNQVIKDIIRYSCGERFVL